MTRVFPGSFRTLTAPDAPLVLMKCRAIGKAELRISSTSHPTLKSEAISARLIIRELRVESRLVTILQPGGKQDPNAEPSRHAKSGVISMLLSPATPRSRNRLPRHLLPHTRDIVTMDPRSTILSGHSLTRGLIVQPTSTRHRSPTTASSRTTLSRLIVVREQTIAEWIPTLGPT